MAYSSIFMSVAVDEKVHPKSTLSKDSPILDTSVGFCSYSLGSQPAGGKS